MSAIEAMRNRVHVILAKHFGVLDANKHGEFRMNQPMFSFQLIMDLDHKD
jgi:hypothetical protein